MAKFNEIEDKFLRKRIVKESEEVTIIALSINRNIPFCLVYHFNLHNSKLKYKNQKNAQQRYLLSTTTKP